MKKRYRINVLGSFGRLLTTRRYYFQAIGKLAALSIPTAELMRMRNECAGDFEKVLGPMRKALLANGYTDIFILPAQTTLVELIPQPDADKGEPQQYEDQREELHRKRLTALRAAFDAFREEFESPTKTDRRLRIAYDALCREFAHEEIEGWESSTS
jgi:hypothetical protein